MSEYNRQLVSKLLAASKIIEEGKRHGKADHIVLSHTYIQKLADDRNISFEEIVDMLKNELK